MTDICVYSVMGTSEHSMVAGVRIARWLAQLTGGDLYGGKEPVPSDRRYRLALVITGPNLLLKDVEGYRRVVRDSERLVLISNDYSMDQPMRLDTNAKGFGRQAYPERRAAGGPHWRWQVWSTVRSCVEKFGTNGKLVNWNALTYEPLQEDVRKELRSVTNQTVFYYGAFRKGRVRQFDRYFLHPPVKTAVSAPAAAAKKFMERYPEIAVVPQIKNRTEFLPVLANHAVGLYIEDEKSSEQYHSPANRLYEMLSAGQAILFQPASQRMLAQAKLDVTQWCGGPDTMPFYLENAESIAAAQREELCRVDHRAALEAHVRQLLEDVQR